MPDADEAGAAEADAALEGAAEALDEDVAGGAALALVDDPAGAALEALVDGALADGALADELELLAPPLPLGGSTATPPLAGAVALAPLEALAPEALEAPLDAWLEPAAAPPDAAFPEDGVDVVDGVEGDDVAGCAELWVVELCAGGVLVWVLCPTGKNEPPVIKVAMIPAITATRAIPISRSGQLRRSQSIVPF